MKPISHFSAIPKMLLAGAMLFCVSPVSGELSAGRSILEQARGADHVFRTATNSDAGFALGALTLDNVYRFDFATAGIGTVVFRNRPNQFRTFIIDQDAPRAVDRWASISDSGSLIRSTFVGSSGFFRIPSTYVAFDDQNPTDPTLPVIAVPEASTWLSGVLALVAIAFARRSWLRQLFARAA
jgi:hypothetical protein